jgi:hypothetical protein
MGKVACFVVCVHVFRYAIQVCRCIDLYMEEREGVGKQNGKGGY